MAVVRGLGLGRGRFDLVNTHFVVPSGPAGQVLARLNGAPHVLSLHGGDLYDPSKRVSPHRHAWLRGPIRHMLKAADALIGQSRNTVQHVKDIYGVDRSVDLIPLGIERPPAVCPASRAEFGLPADAFVMTTVGRIVPRKATVQLVTALKRSALPQAHLLMVGDGPDADAVRRAAREAGVDKRVHLLGPLAEQEKYRVLAMSDVFVSSSQHEGFGLVFLEAMAIGLPIVCYDQGGQTDFLSTHETGYVIRLNDLEAFTRALVDLAHDRAERAAIGARNRKRAEQYFIDTCAARYENIFLETQERHCRRMADQHRTATLKN
jgi:glycosyltransferase involved in cell wall biosynthesis